MMKSTITCTETLETIFTQNDLHPVLHELLRRITYQERVETDLLTSLRAKNSYPEWVAGLAAIDPIAELIDEKAVPLSTLLENKTQALKDLKEIHLDLHSNAMLAYDQVSNTPAGRPIVAVIVFIDFDKEGITKLRIAATGVSKTPYFYADFSKEMEGKQLSRNMVAGIGEKFLKMITPADTYMGSAAYRKEMAGVLVERILSNKVNGEIG